MMPIEEPRILSYPTPPLTSLAERAWVWLWRWRFFYFVNIRKNLRTLDSALSFRETVQHNVRSLRQLNPRMNRLIKPLAAMENVPRDARILVIGPRNEWDLVLLAKEGFHNTMGVDLITYSPCIRLVDMHTLENHFPSSTFDVVLCGWTISYSAHPQIVANQIVGVAKNGGVIGIAVEYAKDDPQLDEPWQRTLGYELVERARLPKRVNSADDILALFGYSVKEVFWRHDAPLKKAHLPDKLIPDPSSVCVLFSIQK